MDNFVSTLKDNGGVHINSGIPNHAFYLAAMSLGGQSWDRAFPIWYQALCILKGQSDCDFQTFAQATLKAASNYEGGESSEEYQAVLAAWLKVGIDPNAVAISQPADPYSCVIL